MNEEELRLRRKLGKPLIALGRLVATPGALKRLEEHAVAPAALLGRHVMGDWGVLEPEDVATNDASVLQGLRVLSSYPLSSDVSIWIITEADRSVTTLLLPSEY